MEKQVAIKISTNKKIRNLIEEQKEYMEKYGENSKRTINLNEKIDKEINNNNSK